MPSLIKSILDSGMQVSAGRSPQCFTFDVSDAIVSAASNAQTYICFKATTQMANNAYLVINGVQITASYVAPVDTVNNFNFVFGNALFTATNLSNTIQQHPAFQSVIVGISNPRPNEYCVVLTSCDIGLDENWSAYGVVTDAANVMPSFSVSKGSDAELLKDYKLVLTLLPSDYAGCGTLDTIQFVAPLVLDEYTRPIDATIDLSSLGFPLVNEIDGGMSPTQMQAFLVSAVATIHTFSNAVNGYSVRYAARYLAPSGQSFVTKWVKGDETSVLYIADAKDNYLTPAFLDRTPYKAGLYKWLTVDTDLQGIQHTQSPKPQTFGVGSQQVGHIGIKFASIIVNGYGGTIFQVRQRRYDASGVIVGSITKNQLVTGLGILTIGVGYDNSDVSGGAAYSIFDVVGISTPLRVDYCGCHYPAIEVHFFNKCAGYDTVLFERVETIDYEVGQVEVCRGIACGGVDRTVSSYDYAGLYAASNRKFNTGAQTERFTLTATVNKSQLQLLENFKEAEQRWIYADSFLNTPIEGTTAILPRSVMVEGDSLRIFQANEAYKITVTIIVREQFH